MARKSVLKTALIMDAIERHCIEIERCNQRGGRMLSIVDLLAAGTVTRELAAFFIAAIQQGASFMIGAMPGGAGKTTVMGALLNLVPAEVELRAADSIETMQAGLRRNAPRACYIAHEIGPGHYYAYLWDRELRAFFDLAAAGHILASNLHADSLTEAQFQICQINSVPPELFRKINLIIFLEVTGSWPARRWISEVWENDEKAGHRQIFQKGHLELSQSRLITNAQLNEAAIWLDTLTASDAKTIQSVRKFLLQQKPLQNSGV